TAQAGKAESDDFVLYNHMWCKGGTDLGPLGRYQLELMAKRLPTVPFPVVIATSKDAALDQARREVVVAQLAAWGFTDPTRVVVAYPIAEGLYGDEAYRIADAYLGLPGGGFGGGLLGGGLGGGLGGFGRLPGGGFNAFRGFGGALGIGRP